MPKKSNSYLIQETIQYLALASSEFYSLNRNVCQGNPQMLPLKVGPPGSQQGTASPDQVDARDPVTTITPSSPQTRQTNGNPPQTRLTCALNKSAQRVPEVDASLPKVTVDRMRSDSLRPTADLPCPSPARSHRHKSRTLPGTDVAYSPAQCFARKAVPGQPSVVLHREGLRIVEEAVERSQPLDVDSALPNTGRPKEEGNIPLRLRERLKSPRMAKSSSQQQIECLSGLEGILQFPPTSKTH
jgi:hypothetical protein